MSNPALGGLISVEITRQTVLVNGLPAHYEVAGAGEPVVLVHGLSESTHLWYRNLPELAERYRVYLVDLPGFGMMRKPRQPFKLTQASVWLAGWMQAVGLEAAALVGHSMGGYVSMALAAAQPTKVTRLVLVDSIGMPFDLPVARLVPQAFKAIARTTPLSLWLCMGYDYLRAGPSTIRDVSRQIVELDAREIAVSVQVPTLLIWGENDDLVPFRFGHQLHEQISDARLFVMRGANHFCMYEQPGEFNRALVTFLQGQDIAAFSARTSTLLDKTREARE
jgi:pimeloyl-ACP methyl ester carboxylesterase